MGHRAGRRGAEKGAEVNAPAHRPAHAQPPALPTFRLLIRSAAKALHLPPPVTQKNSTRGGG